MNKLVFGNINYEKMLHLFIKLTALRFWMQKNHGEESVIIYLSVYAKPADWIANLFSATVLHCVYLLCLVHMLKFSCVPKTH